MKNMQKVSQYLSKVFTFSALAFILSLITISFLGVYFLGDTVTYMQFGSMGSPLTTFIQHDGLWPPLFALLYNVANHLPISPFLLASLWVSATLSVYILLATLFVHQMGIKKGQALALVTLCITGPLTLVLQSYISEPLTLLLWLATLYATVQFWKTSQEKWLVLWLIVAALLPMSRWLGALVTLWFSGWIFLKLLLDLKKAKKPTYSPWLVLLILATVWVPIGLYLFRTKVLIGSFFPLRDAQLRSASEIAVRYAQEIMFGAGLATVAAFLLGLGSKIKTTAFHKVTAMLTFGSGALYLAGLLFSESHYFIVPHIPSRFVGLSFPFIILTAFMVGILCQKFAPTKMKPWLRVAGAVLGSIVILGALATSISRLKAETASPEPLYTYAGWTGDSANYCRPNTNLIYHVHTRNWGAHSLDYLCKTATVVTTPTHFSVEQGATVISPYEIENLELTDTFTLNEYVTYIYTATQSATIDVEKLFSNRSVFQ
ncbi:MAG: hypothetical protein H6773_03275 [Pseudomonadales bacterium]|nr:hypothetical protein [Pseudomonadales bacterium]